MNDRFFLEGEDGFFEGERFGNVWRIWEYDTDVLQENLEIPVRQISDFVAYWQKNGYPHFEMIHGEL